MKQMLQIYCKNNNISKEFPIGSSLLDIYYGFNLNFPYQVVSAKVNNRSEGLNFRVYNNKDVDFLDVRDSSGMRTYVRSLCFVLYKAVSELFPDGNFSWSIPYQKDTSVTSASAVPSHWKMYRSSKKGCRRLLPKTFPTTVSNAILRKPYAFSASTG